MHREYIPQQRTPEQEAFVVAVDKELSNMEGAGRISADQARKKREAALLIENGLSNDPEKDALLFCKAGIAGEEELIGILNERE